jgi:hypothetical protein
MTTVDTASTFFARVLVALVWRVDGLVHGSQVRSHR